MLTDDDVMCADSKNKPYKIYDGGGLYLLVNPNGSKWWRLKYRMNRKEKTLSIGRADFIPVIEAREKSLSAKTLIAEGIDPSQLKQEMKAARADAKEEKRPYRLTDRDKAIADYMVDQIASRFGLLAKVPF